MLPDWVSNLPFQKQIFLIVQLYITFTYLKGKEKHRDKNSHSLLCFPYAWDRQGWARWKSIQISHGGGRDPSTWTKYLNHDLWVPRKCLSKKLDRKQSQDSNSDTLIMSIASSMFTTAPSAHSLGYKSQCKFFFLLFIFSPSRGPVGNKVSCSVCHNEQLPLRLILSSSVHAGYREVQQLLSSPQNATFSLLFSKFAGFLWLSVIWLRCTMVEIS